MKTYLTDAEREALLKAASNSSKLVAKGEKPSDFKLLGIVEKLMTLEHRDRLAWNPDITLLMHMLSIDDVTGYEDEVLADGGIPRKAVVQIHVKVKYLD